MTEHKEEVSINKIQKYEMMYIRFTWAFIVLSAVYVLLAHAVNFSFRREYTSVFFNVACLAVIAALNLLKCRLLRKGLFEKQRVYLLSRAVELFAISFAIVFVEIGQWAYVMLIFPVLVTSLCKGTKSGAILVGASLIIHSLIYASRSYIFSMDDEVVEAYNLTGWILLFVFYYISLFLFAFLCGMIHKDRQESEEKKGQLLEQLEDKYNQLEMAQEEIKNHYEKLKDANIKLEDTNKKLSNSIAEFFTLQQISQAIGSILDIKELLKHVNDIILGVMGVSHSTIILYDDKRKRLKVHTTNIKDHNHLITLNDNINCSILLNALDSGKPIIENFVDPADYEFTEGREVNSLICVSFNTQSRKFGLVLIEQKYYNAFDEDNVRLLDIIGQQVGFAMENAELYQKMQDLATKDGLTGIYNRLYFQERLQKEFEISEEDQYQLALAIFDIDHFKRFNDTFGHLFGDKVLKSITEAISNMLRNTDIFARYGGEEFVILFPRTSVEEAYEKVELLRRKIETTTVKDQLVEASVTISFGIAGYPENASSEAELLRKANDALYDAKESGRNCVKVSK